MRWGEKDSHLVTHNTLSWKHQGDGGRLAHGPHRVFKKATNIHQMSDFLSSNFPKGIVDRLPHRDRIQIFRTKFRSLGLPKELYGVSCMGSGW